MRTKFYLDIRKRRSILVTEDEENELYPVKIAINHGGSSAYIGTGLSVKKSQWVSKPSPGRVTGGPNSAKINILLAEKKLKIDKTLEELREKGELRGRSVSEIKSLVEKLLEANEDGEVPVLDCFDKYIGLKRREGTVAVYKATISKLKAYRDFTESMTFRSVTPSWLAGFEEYLAETSPSANARGIYLRNIRTVFNYALAEEWTKAQYPFKKFKIRKSPTKDRSLSREDLRALRNARCNKAVEKYRDLFLLSFYLCGMNLEDILALKEIKGGRVEVERIKTGQPLTIKVVPEAMDIISKYKGDDGHLISLGAGVNYRNFQHRVNRYLKEIGRTYNTHTRAWEGESLFKDISFYYARYSWATIAAELDIPERTIGKALGHSTSNSVTSIYTRVDMRKKIDDANRKVIDFVFGDLQNPNK